MFNFLMGIWLGYLFSEIISENVPELKELKFKAKPARKSKGSRRSIKRR